MAYDMEALASLLGGVASNAYGGANQTGTAAANTPVPTTAQGGGFGGMSPTAITALLGNLAGIIGEGKTVGAGLGQLAVQGAQAQEIAQGGKKNESQLSDLLQSLTGEGVTTTGVKVGDDGTLQVTGTRPTRVAGIGNETPTEQTRPF